jgi:hypothetical protein
LLSAKHPFAGQQLLKCARTLAGLSKTLHTLQPAYQHRAAHRSFQVSLKVSDSSLQFPLVPLQCSYKWRWFPNSLPMEFQGGNIRENIPSTETEGLHHGRLVSPLCSSQSLACHHKYSTRPGLCQSRENRRGIKLLGIIGFLLISIVLRHSPLRFSME